MIARRERFFWIGDGMRAPENDEMVGRPVNIHGRRGRVVGNDAFFITVEWDAVRTSWWRRFLGCFGRGRGGE